MGVIRRIEIRNFRSIHHLVLNMRLCDLNLFVGNNDVGKSNILKAVNLFFNNQTDLGRQIDFWEDFNKRIVRTSGRGQYIKVVLDIDLKYEKNKYARWTRQWGNSGARNKDEIVVFDNETGVEAKFENYTRAKGWLDRIVYRYVPAIKSEQYFQHLFEELHDLLNKSYSEKFGENTQALIKSIQDITQDITSELTEELSLEHKISLPSDLRAFFGTLDFSLDIGGQNFKLKGRGDGIKVRHIPVILNFLAVKAKVLKQGAVDIKTIWGFEEPENNLEMSHAFLMAKTFLRYGKKIDILLSTHSPSFYSLKDEANVICWFVSRNDEGFTIANNIVDETVDLDDKMGVLQYVTPFVKLKDEDLQKKTIEVEKLRSEVKNLSDTTKIVVFTEDETEDLKMIRTFMQIQGFKDEYTAYHSYYGRDNFHAAVVAADMFFKKFPNIRYFLFHRDMDVDGEYFRSQNEPRLQKNGRKNYILVMPKGYDIESEFVNPQHVNTLYNKISVERAAELIAESTKEVERKSLKKLRETYMSVKTIQNLAAGIAIKDFKWDNIISEVDTMYHNKPERYRYGKSVLGILSDKIRNEIGGKVNLIQPTNFIVRDSLQAVAEAVGSS